MYRLDPSREQNNIWSPNYEQRAPRFAQEIGDNFSFVIFRTIIIYYGASRKRRKYCDIVDTALLQCRLQQVLNDIILPRYVRLLMSEKKL